MSQDIQQILRFKGQWRPYQMSVLEELEHYISDQKIHVIAAPGAGKTVLGIELIRQAGHHAIILTPRINIQRQWIESCKALFLEDGAGQSCLSTDPENLSQINVFTYQSVPKLLKLLGKGPKRSGEARPVFTLVLDECHHLTGAWADDVQDLQQRLDIGCIISLTATPPYEVEQQHWIKYKEICGEVDVEISVPQLVQHGSLCPHQDFVYASHPTAEENTLLSDISEQRNACVEKILNLPELDNVLAHDLDKFAQADSDFLAINMHAYRALLALCLGRGPAFVKKIEDQHQIEADKIEAFQIPHLEAYLNYVLFSSDPSQETKAAVQQIKRICLEDGFLDEEGVRLVTPPAMQEILETSTSKIASIQNIVLSEYDALRENLRQLILLDQIGADRLTKGQKTEHKNDQKKSPEKRKKLTAIAVFSGLHESLAETDIDMAMVSGQLAILPQSFAQILIDEGVLQPAGKKAAARPAKENADQTSVTFAGFDIFYSGHKGFDHIEPRCTAWLKEGRLKLLIGTGSLLGEGWDCPSVNSLIMASQIGSFVSSNQMRGRAIRKFEASPEKVSNVWHLITLDDQWDMANKDWLTLTRRFKTFVGPSYSADEILSGIERVQLAGKDSSVHAQDNAALLALSCNRSQTAEKWKLALEKGTRSVLAHRIDVNRLQAPKRLLFGNLFRGKGWFSKIANPIIYASFKPFADSQTILTQRVIRKIIKALYDGGFIDTKPRKFKIGFAHKSALTITGGLQREIAVITRSVHEFFTFSPETRYALAIKTPLCKRCHVFAPKLLADNKTRLDMFLKYIERVLGPLEPVFLQGDAGEALKIKLLREQIMPDQKNDVTQGRVWL